MKDFKTIGYKRHIDRCYFYTLSLFAVGLFILGCFTLKAIHLKCFKCP